MWVRSPSNLGSPATAHLEPICLLPTLPPKTCGQASALPELTTLQEPPKPRSARLLPDLRVHLKDRPTCTPLISTSCFFHFVLPTHNQAATDTLSFSHFFEEKKKFYLEVGEGLGEGGGTFPGSDRKHITCNSKACSTNFDTPDIRRARLAC